MRSRLLDLFCGADGAGEGYHRASWKAGYMRGEADAQRRLGALTRDLLDAQNAYLDACEGGAEEVPPEVIDRLAKIRVRCALEVAQ